LNQATADAVAASAAFAALPVNRPDVTILDNNMTIDATVSGANVFLLSGVNLNGKTVILNGMASDYFIFNVTGDLFFSASNINLVGGITASHVLFNFIGPAPGDELVLKNSGNFRGTVLAPDRAIRVDHLTVTGALIGGGDGSFSLLDKAGSSMSVHSAAVVQHAPFTAPEVSPGGTEEEDESASDVADAPYVRISNHSAEVVVDARSLGTGSDVPYIDRRQGLETGANRILGGGVRVPIGEWANVTSRH
jgi:hypothetical protein